MEIEEDLNLKILEDVKKLYLQSFDYIKNGISSSLPSDKKFLADDDIDLSRITFLYKFISVNPTLLLINEKTQAKRRIFQGEYLYGKKKIQFNIIAKNLEIERELIQFFKKPYQCYIMHNVQVFQMLNKNKNNNVVEFMDSEDLQSSVDCQLYYLIDESSHVLEDDSMDFISTLTRLSDSFNSNEFVFETNYSIQISQMPKPLNTTHFKLLQPKVVNSFEGVILQVQEGKNILQIEELIDQVYLNSRRDRFYILKVANGKNYMDFIEVYLVYDNEDQEAKQQLQFYLKPFQRILIFQSLKHFTKNLKLFMISFFYSSGVQPNNSNVKNFLVSHKGVEFFSRFDIQKNELLCKDLIKSYNKLPLSNISKLLEDEGVMIRSNMKFQVRVKKVKYFKIRLNCLNCKQEWTVGLKNCINCKGQQSYISYNIQVLVQDQHFLEQQAYIYLYDDLAAQFFNITESEKKELHLHLTKNETFIQLYYSFNKDYPLSIIKFKDKIFNKDITNCIVAYPFADIDNKIFNSQQQIIQDENLRIESEKFIQNFTEDNNLQESKLYYEKFKSKNKQQIFVNGTYISTNYSQGQKICLKPIPCLKVMYVFPQEDIKLSALKIIEEINQLKIQIDQLN
ncbi:telomerase-associated protein p75 (macronuclear) [Tetrahymena thermophila SB210]|uniref:Telomerase-associated protein of 75 kDa n=1 Tax=Tetrahymena thermophila (strain SB210) TaxID=312017 RepID=TAP75_TETTS|nr:telomerase-associated protein p75 [Tetrahymena thermophila SB210]A0PGB2.1 RecName: Full=Telomerase-associated protein of 75 kDa; Short=p75 [Tetrahymena thermophila SB210]7UY5_I Chain I, Telomerase-associated protein of 75 kDa [Tetrahymena thermophila]7UY7_A Chain A, Telomerase-associated protein of 75 kDa [Tetrahymena thermophila]AAS97866.1 telomerase-associated protein p75 [Tetrahymena thermophila]EAR87391.2 telomerase-associated protein p75 [Tetrahymena thermophila SB210]|eukprot:XP_001007636.2 telomerase-associated protein p75 [Tetrahymena thermophila SB210]